MYSSPLTLQPIRATAEAPEEAAAAEAHQDACELVCGVWGALCTRTLPTADLPNGRVLYYCQVWKGTVFGRGHTKVSYRRVTLYATLPVQVCKHQMLSGKGMVVHRLRAGVSTQCFNALPVSRSGSVLVQGSSAVCAGAAH